MRKKLQHHLQQVIARQYPDFSGSVALERPKNVEHGDYTTNIALILGKMYKKKPQEVAHAIVEARRNQPITRTLQLAEIVARP